MTKPRLGAAAVTLALITILLTGCGGGEHNASGADGVAVDLEKADSTPSPDDLTVTGGEDPYEEIIGGVFVDDADALAAAVNTLRDYIDLYREINASGDPMHGDLTAVVTPALAREIRTYLAAELHGPQPDPGLVEVEDPVILKRIDGDFARVAFAYCRVDSGEVVDETGEPTWVERRTETTASAVSTSENPEELRIEAILPWLGDPFC